MSEVKQLEEAYKGWAVVELMGHRVIAGQVSEVVQFGSPQLRIDVPGLDGTAITQFYGGSAIYSLTPCDEETARHTLRQRYTLPEPVRLALPPQPEVIPDHEFEDEGPA